MLHWKEKFTDQVEKFQVKIENSFDSLHQSLSASVEAGIQEVKAHLREAAASYTHPVASHLWSFKGDFGLLREIADFGEVFELMEMCLSETKSAFEVNLLGGFEADNCVLLRWRRTGEIKALRKAQRRI